MGEKRYRAADLEGVIDLPRRVTVVERGDDEAGPEAGKIKDQKCRPVRHQGCDAVARRDSEGEEIGGEAISYGFELIPTPARPGGDQRDRIGMAVQASAQQVGDVDGMIYRRAGKQHGGFRPRQRQ
jgi:hypothetical protein